MTQEQTDHFIKSVALQMSAQPSMPDVDANLENVLRSLQLSDGTLIRILKGEIQEQMDKLEKLVVERYQYQQINHEDAMKILAVTQDIKHEVKHYYKMVPYLMMVSPVMWLSNLSEEEVKRIQSKQSCMVWRHRLESEDEDETKVLQDSNFYDAIEIVMHVIAAGSTKGWKSNVINKEVREQTVRILDGTEGQKKRRLF
jgi:hypothetical protein